MPLNEENQWDYDNLDAPQCPHCDKSMSDAWELNLRDGEDTDVTCGWCGKNYDVVCHFSVTYSTTYRGGGVLQSQPTETPEGGDDEAK